MTYLTIRHLRRPGLIPGRGGVFQEISPRLITLCQPVLSQCGGKWLNPHSMDGTIQPVNMDEEGLHPVMGNL